MGRTEGCWEPTDTDLRALLDRAAWWHPRNLGMAIVSIPRQHANASMAWGDAWMGDQGRTHQAPTSMHIGPRQGAAGNLGWLASGSRFEHPCKGSQNEMALHAWSVATPGKEPCCLSDGQCIARTRVNAQPASQRASAITG